MKIDDKIKRVVKLTNCIRYHAREIGEGGMQDASSAVAVLKSRYDITANMHVGKGDEMQPDTIEAKLMQLEWYAGSLVDIVDNASWLAMNSWINCVDKFVPDLAI